MDEEKLPVRLVTGREEHQQLVRKYLEEAKAENMVDVMIVGSLPHGEVFMVFSPSMNRAEMIGYLEQAKFRILSHIDSGQDGKET